MRKGTNAVVSDDCVDQLSDVQIEEESLFEQAYAQIEKAR